MSATAGPRHAGATLAIDLGAIRSKLPPAPPAPPATRRDGLCRGRQGGRP